MGGVGIDFPGIVERFIRFVPDVRAGFTFNVTVTLVGGVGSCMVPDGCTLVGLISDTAGVYAAFNETPTGAGVAASNNATLADLKIGLKIPTADTQWDSLPQGTGRRVNLLGAGVEKITLEFR